jgi:hypothetical protein
MKPSASILAFLVLGGFSEVLAEPPKVLFRSSGPGLRPPVTARRVPLGAAKPAPTVPLVRMHAATATPAPGLYAAVPFSAIVAVPKPVDPKFSVGQHADIPNARIVEPPLKLGPLRR